MHNASAVRLFGSGGHGRSVSNPSSKFSVMPRLSGVGYTDEDLRETFCQTDIRAVIKGIGFLIYT